MLVFFPVFKEGFVCLFLLTAQNFNFSYKKDKYIDGLKVKNVRLTLEVDRLKKLKEENERLKKALHITERNKTEIIYAKIVGFSPSTWRRIAYIPVGTTHGVTLESMVVNEEGFLVGKVEEVKKSFSTIVLLDDPHFSASVFIKDKGMGLLQGTLRGRLNILYVEEQQNVGVNDQVWAVCGKLKSSIPAGRISSVIEKDDQLFLDVEMVPFAKAYSVREVFILK